jgi:glycosyltransferase involved in cell wall biosynthesis
MTIAIDGYEANVAARVGIGRYAYEIMRALYELISARQGEKNAPSVRVYLPDAPLPDMPKETPWWRYRIAAPKRLWTFIGFPYALAVDRPGADVVFSPTHYAPRFTARPRVISIMDVSYLRYPEMFRPRDLHQLVTWTAYSAAHSKAILTISEFSRRAIMEAYKVPASRVVVTYPGLPGHAHTMTPSPKKNPKHAPYILAVGTVQPRKNYARLIEAFAQAAPKLEADYPGLSLRIVGKKGWLYEDILATPKKLGIEEKVEFLNFVDDAKLPGLYEGALCLVTPSLYEGFGLPVLEAMAHGCLVVVANVSSLPEIAGEAGIYVDPMETSSIATGLIEAAREYGTEKGQQRQELGYTQVKKFSWEKAAKQTLKVLEEVGKGR